LVGLHEKHAVGSRNLGTVLAWREDRLTRWVIAGRSWCDSGRKNA